MSRVLTLELSDAAYAGLERHARAAATSPTALAATALEHQFRDPDGPPQRGRSTTETDPRTARERFERHFGAVNLGYPTGTDNEAIDADLARAYADSHEGD